MPEITKSGAKLRLFIVTHKYTDLYFIFFFQTPLLAKITFPNLYNRSSAVDSSFNNQPQVGKPTWGYNYPTVLRRLPSPSATIHRIAHPHRKKHHHHPIAPMARCEKTAEERFNMLARGWLAYPVTPTHLPTTAEERLYKRHPIGLPTRDALRHTQRAEPPFPGSPALRLNQLLFSYSITFCALPSTTTT